MGRSVLRFLADIPQGTLHLSINYTGPATNIIRDKQLYLADVLTYSVALLFAKLSILLLYYRIFGFGSKVYTYLWWSTLFVTVGYLVSSMLASIFSCTPIAASWDVTVSGKCINKPVLFMVNTVLGMVTDLALLVLPTIILWRLNFSRRQKIFVFLLLSIGSLYVELAFFCSDLRSSNLLTSPLVPLSSVSAVFLFWSRSSRKTAKISHGTWCQQQHGRKLHPNPL